MPRVRITDIAAEAGVSQTTVSRFLNRRYDAMSDATRQRIAAVVERTGYRPSSAARSLRTERSNTLGVVLADIQNPYSMAMLEALDRSAAAHGYSLMTTVSDNDAAREAEGIQRLVDAGVDGLVINTCGGNDELIVEIDTATPVVLLDRALESDAVDLVTSNNAELMRGLLAEVAEAGATYCVLVTEPDDASSIRRERARMFTSGLEARGMPGEVLTLDRRADRARGQLDRLRAEHAHDVLGIIAVNGLVFLRLVEALGATGGATPGGVRSGFCETEQVCQSDGERSSARSNALPYLATFDDYTWNRMLFGGVTTAVQDTDAIARAVFDRIAQRIARCKATKLAPEPLEPLRLEIPGRIARRATTSPNPHR